MISACGRTSVGRRLGRLAILRICLPNSPNFPLFRKTFVASASCAEVRSSFILGSRRESALSISSLPIDKE
jgi:hypothetical protein